MKSCVSVMIFLAVLGSLVESAKSQNFNQWAGRELYVSPQGSDANSGAFSTPMRTITAALIRAMTGQQVATTVNVFPGTYNLANGEIFPLLMPMHGIKLEAIAPGVVINATGVGSSTPAISVVLTPVTNFIPSIIRGFEITGGGIGVEFAAGDNIVPTTEWFVLRPEVRDCNIHDNLGPNGVGGYGIDIRNLSHLRTEVVVENNEIHHHGTLNVPSAGIRIRTGNEYSFDSTLIRRNRIYFQEVGVDLGAPVGVCRPRLFSNFLWHHEQHVFSVGSGPWIINNTLAFALPFSSNPTLTAIGHFAVGTAQNEDMSAGLILNPMSTLLVVRNSILWNPDVAGFSAPEVSGSGPYCRGFNDMQDLGTNINFVDRGGNVVIPTVPQFRAAPTDLRLVAVASPQVETAELALLVQGALFDLDGRLPPVSLDVSIDNEGDCRALEFNKVDAAYAPDRGGDEVRAPGDVNLGTTNVDPYGNVRTTSAADGTLEWNFNLTLTARTGEAAAILCWAADPAGPIDMNYMNAILPPLGNVLLPVGGTFTLLSGFVTGTSFTFPGAGMTLGYNPSLAECEMYFQGFTLNLATGKGDLSNRVRVELNE